MRMLLVRVVLLIFASPLVVLCQPACPAGSYKNCHGNCAICTRINNPALEKVLKNCTDTQDAIIRCIDGYYRSPRISVHEPGDCRKCTTECPDNNPVLTRHCRDDKNAICCPDENYHVVEKNGTAQCVLYCGRGEFLDKAKKICLPCPNNTFMDKEKHTNEDCITCRSLQPLQRETSKCNKTHPTGIGCIEGLYGTPSEPSYDYDVDCKQCQVCEDNNTHPYDGLACGATYNTVCCTQPMMTVISSPRGFECQPTPTHSVSSSPAPTEPTMPTKVTEATQGGTTTTAPVNKGNVAVAVVSAILILLSPFMCMPVEFYRDVWARVRNLAGNP